MPLPEPPMPRPRKPDRPRPTRAEKRQQILAAARALFRSRGYAETTPEAVAEAAGVKPATVAKHFPNKADLFAGLYDQFHAAAFDPQETGPQPDSMQFWLHLPGRFDKVAKTYRDLVGLVVRGLAEAADPELTEVIGASLSRTADALMGLIREGQRAGMVRRGVDPTRAAWEWVRWLFGGLLLKPTDAEPAPQDDDVPPQPADILLHGLLKTDV
jgi:AcrR family transcriptional regulator